MKRFYVITPYFKQIFCLILLCFICIFCACEKKVNYFDYVSELRENIFIAEREDYFLKIHSTVKETPRSLDGIKRDSVTLTEVFLTAPSGEETYTLTFHVDNKKYGGEMSYNNVRGEYYFSCTLDTTKLSQIVCELSYNQTTFQLTAKSVRSKEVLSASSVLEKLAQTEKNLFQALTDKYGFQGEICIRLIYEDAPYYYVGVTDKKEKTTAYLLNAISGQILAKK